ncbi:MAG: hypothetical protein J5I98_14040 [Phaeodactylibacter sp.]|nr:hypothetical protein [Phaeodactylibacter sp.]
MKDKQTWKEFYEAAIAYRDLKPWEWMHDSDIFGIQDPESGEIGYCCVMGNAGEVYALGLYPGDEGFKSYLLLLNQPDEISMEDQFALGLNQIMFKVEFVDRSELSEKDLKQIKALGLKFRGRNQWVQARHHLPGTLGRPINAEQAKRLTHALRQACEVAARYEEDEDVLYGKDDKMLLRVPEQKEGQLAWKDKYVTHKGYNITPFPVIKPSPALVKKAKKELKHSKGAILFLFQYMRSQVKGDDGLPFLPRLALWITYPDGMIVSMEMLGREDGLEKLEASFFKLVRQMGFIPRQIVFNSMMGSNALSRLAMELEIEMMYAPEEKIFEEVMRSMDMFL